MLNRLAVHTCTSTNNAAWNLHHTHYVNCVFFSPDRKLLVVACNDHNARTWDVTSILKEAGLDDLLSRHDNSPLAACDTFIENFHALRTDATRRTPCLSANQGPQSDTRGFF
jgi:WD40 repeat protein